MSPKHAVNCIPRFGGAAAAKCDSMLRSNKVIYYTVAVSGDSWQSGQKDEIYSSMNSKSFSYKTSYNQYNKKKSNTL